MIKVTSGVPQGSHLGPLLFLLFINDLPSVIKYSHCLLFADDLKIFRVISDDNDHKMLQLDLDAIVEWCRKNCLFLNTDKCQCFTLHRTNSALQFNYNINNSDLVRIYNKRDLGLLLDQKLCFNDHINEIIRKAYSMLGFVKRNSVEFSDPHTLKSLYVSLVRPHLEYCCIIWNPNNQYQSNRIELVQKNFTRFMFYKLNWRIERPSYETRCALFDLCSLATRRKMFAVLFVRDLVHHHIRCSSLLSLLNFYAPLRPLRDRFHFTPVFYRSRYGEKETITNSMNIVNSIVDSIDIFFEQPRVRFKNLTLEALAN